MNIFSKLLLVGGVNETADPTRTANAWASIGLNNGELYFSASGDSQTSGGGYSGGMVKGSGDIDISSGGGYSGGMVKGSGDIDISRFSKGDVNFSIFLEDEIWNAGYRFPSDVYQAVAIAYYPPKSTTVPPAAFGNNHWPPEFGAPSFVDGGKKLVFVDKDDNNSAYEYSIAVIKPGGERIVLDPKIKNGGQQ